MNIESITFRKHVFRNNLRNISRNEWDESIEFEVLFICYVLTYVLTKIGKIILSLYDIWHEIDLFYSRDHFGKFYLLKYKALFTYRILRKLTLLINIVHITVLPVFSISDNHINYSNYCILLHIITSLHKTYYCQTE